jgi:hypothetical protein
MFDRKDYIKENQLKHAFKVFKIRLNIFDIGACEGEETIRYKNIFPFSFNIFI